MKKERKSQKRWLNLPESSFLQYRQFIEVLCTNKELRQRMKEEGGMEIERLILS